MNVTRLFGGPIIAPGLGGRIGHNINGPSLIRAPNWLPAPLGAYYLYFASHTGDHIRLAYADALAGPWRVHEAGALELEDSLFPTARLVPDDITNPVWVELMHKHGEKILGALGPHIASPDVHVDADRREIRMYFHGLLGNGEQLTRLAVSRDGVHFDPQPELLGPSYFRVFRHDGWFYAMASAGRLYRSRDGHTPFECGPAVIDSAARHTAVRQLAGRLQIFWSRVGDTPERILCSTVDLSGDWIGWHANEPEEIIRPEHDWEGADLPTKPSRAGFAIGRVHELRDPAVFVERDASFLLYSISGENGIAIAELESH